MAYDERHVYAVPDRLGRNEWALDGEWTVGREMAVAEAPGARIVYRFHARDAHLILAPAAGRGPARFRVRLDGAAPGGAHGLDVDADGNGTVVRAAPVPAHPAAGTRRRPRGRGRAPRRRAAGVRLHLRLSRCGASGPIGPPVLSLRRSTVRRMSADAGRSNGAAAAASGASIVLLTLASAQFLMTLDTSVMNVSIATVAEDVGTTVTGIQTAITMYTLVMAAFMITGGKIGEIIGRKRALAIGLVIYGCGSLTTALAPSLPVLLIGWSLLEGLGAVLILPAIVALVAANFARDARPRAYGLVASAGAIAVAAGPLIGGLFTTYASWRWVFAGEVLIVIVILILTRRIADTPGQSGVKLDLVGTALSALGLGLFVYGVLRSGSWGFIRPKPNAPEWLGLSPVTWLMTGGLAVLLLFLSWEDRLIARGDEPLINLPRLRNPVLRGGLLAFMFQYLLQSGLFFVVPLYLSVALGLSAIATGVRLLPLSLTLLLAAVGVPGCSPERPRDASSGSASSPCSPASPSWSPCSTSAPGPRSSPGRCCSPGWGSAPSPHSSVPSPCRQCPTSAAARSAASRTRSRTSALRSERHSPAPC